MGVSPLSTTTRSVREPTPEPPRKRDRGLQVSRDSIHTRHLVYGAHGHIFVISFQHHAPHLVVVRLREHGRTRRRKGTAYAVERGRESGQKRVDHVCEQSFGVRGVSKFDCIRWGAGASTGALTRPRVSGRSYDTCRSSFNDYLAHHAKGFVRNACQLKGARLVERVCVLDYLPSL